MKRRIVFKPTSETVPYFVEKWSERGNFWLADWKPIVGEHHD